MNIRLRLTLLLIFLFLAAILNSAFIFKLESHGEDKLSWVIHTHEVLSEAKSLLSTLTDAETGQRGFLLTLDTNYLAPYHSGIVYAKEHLDSLNKLTADNLSQQELLAIISLNMDLKLIELGDTIELALNGDKTEALAIVVENRGKLFMDKIRKDLTQFTNKEKILLEQRKGEFRQNRTQITTLIAVEIVFFIGLAIYTLTFLQRSFFMPLQLLLQSAHKVKRGDKLEVADVVEKNEMGNLLSTFFMMSEKVNDREAVLTHKANHDTLTGLKNRSCIAGEIEAAIDSAVKSNSKVAAFFIDLNSFKQVNDTLGHAVGDLILQETANRLTASVRESDTVFRVGGDEFLVLISNVKNDADIVSAVKNILKVFDKSATIQGRPTHIAISIGVAVAPDDTLNHKQLVKFADVAMYCAKKNSDSNYQIFNKKLLKRNSDLDKSDVELVN